MGIIKSIFQGILIALGVVIGLYALSYVDITWIDQALRHVTERIGEFIINLGK